MARMHPATLPEETVSQAERILYQELGRQLPDPYVVFHGVKWAVRERHQEHHGECDFVIAHPHRGLLALEVKGGKLHGEWGARRWTSVGRNGISHSTSNPFEQASKAKWSLESALKAGAQTARFTYPSILRMVAFPDMLTADVPLGLDADAAMVLDSRDINTLQAAIERVLTRSGNTTVIPEPAMGALRRLIQPTVEINRPGLGYSIKDGEARILQLTEEQMRLLGVLGNQKQAIINGCAGSGKSILAIEKALQLAEAGNRVLLTCFNKHLAAWMRSVVAADDQSFAHLVSVRHYHDLAVAICDEAGVETSVSHADQAYWDEGLAADLLRAIPNSTSRFEAIVVDEGQDFNESWWITLQELLPDKDAVFYIFQDEHQAIYHRERTLPISAPPFTLTENFRSTNTIHWEVARYYAGDPKPISRGPGGRAIDIIATAPGTLHRTLEQVLRTLMNDEGISADQIVVLSPNGPSRSELTHHLALGPVRLSREPTQNATDIFVSTIHAYKGLESDVVILAETDGFPGRHDSRMLAYVAISRAKHHLIVLGELPHNA